MHFTWRTHEKMSEKLKIEKLERIKKIKAMDAKFNLRLIHHVKRNGILYNKKLPDFKNKPEKDACWNEIAEILDVDVDDCQNRWKSLRDTYRKQVKKPSYEGAPTPWKYTKYLTFLDDCKPKPRRNVETATDDSDPEEALPALKRQRYNAENEESSSPKNQMEFTDPEPPTQSNNVPKIRPETSKSHPFTESEILGKSWALAYKNLPSDQKIFARRGIEEVIFEAQMGTLRRDSIQINMMMDEQLGHHFAPVEEVLIMPKADYVDSNYSEYS